MTNAFFELDQLRDYLASKSVDLDTIQLILSKVKEEIQEALDRETAQAKESAIAAGVEKKSSDFINEIRLDATNFEISTESGRTSFTTPPFPMLYSLLKNAKPMKDGTGVYKVIPVGKPGKNRPALANNIHDAQKRISVERMEAAHKRYAAISPQGSKQQFRTATSKQDPNTQWVRPAKRADFTEELHDINLQMRNSLDDEIRAIIRKYKEMF